MKTVLPYLLVVALTVIACYVIFHKTKGSEREAQLEAQIETWEKAYQKKLEVINFLSGEGEQLKAEKAKLQHEKEEAITLATGYRIKFLRVRDGAIPHLSDSLWNARAKEVARSWKHTNPNF